MDSNIPEFHIVSRDESFSDIAVRELAESRAKCICSLQFGRCKRTRCSHCQINTWYNNCLAEMSDYDKIRFYSKVSEAYSSYSYNPANFMNHKRYVRHYLRIWSGFGILLLLLTLLIGCLFILPCDQKYYRGVVTDFSRLPSGQQDHIVRLLDKMNKYVYDCNNDGKINCIDYAVMFYYWNKLLLHESECEIVRNYNPNKMNHLFIRWRMNHTDQWVEIEPHMYEYGKVLMQDNWTDKEYNPNFNIYGETKKWIMTSIQE